MIIFPGSSGREMHSIDQLPATYVFIIQSQQQKGEKGHDVIRLEQIQSSVEEPIYSFQELAATQMAIE